MLLIGIDPGKGGGFAFYDTLTKRYWCEKMPETDHDIMELLHPDYLKVDPAGVVVCMEQVGGFIGKAQPGSAMFNFGENFGFVRGLVVGFNYRLVMVRPQKWQKELGLGNRTTTGTSGKQAWKNKLKQRAQQLFPNTKVTLSTADALLILQWGIQSQLY